MAGILSLLGNRAPTGAVALKSDLFGAIASNINGSIGATSQLVSDLFNYWNVGRTNDTNREIADRNNQIAINLARENNAWQENLLHQNQDWSSAEAEKAFKRELEKMRIEMDWNSPVRQVERLRAAGLNPALAFGGANTASVAGTSAPQALSVGAGVTPSMPVLTSPRMEAFQMVSPAAAMRDIGEAIAAMSAARKSGAETKQIEETLTDYARKIKADADFAEVGAVLEREFGRGDRTRSQMIADKKIAEITQNISNLAKQGNYTDALAAIADIENLIKQNDLARSNLELDAFPDILRATISSIRASAARDSAQARFTSEQTHELQRMVDYNVDIRRNQAQMSQADVMKQGAVLYDEIDYLLGHFENLSERERAELQQVKAAADAAKWKYDIRWVDWSLNTIERINNGVTNWIPFAPDKTTVTDDNTTFDTNLRTGRDGELLYHDDRTHNTVNKRTYERSRSWHR